MTIYLDKYHVNEKLTWNETTFIDSQEWLAFIPHICNGLNLNSDFIDYW